MHTPTIKTTTKVDITRLEQKMPINLKQMMAKSLTQRQTKEAQELEQTIQQQAERDKSPQSPARFKSSRSKSKSSKSTRKRKRNAKTPGTPLCGGTPRSVPTMAAFPIPSTPINIKPVVRRVQAANIRPFEGGTLMVPDDEDETVTVVVNKSRLKAHAIVQITEGDTLLFRLYSATVREDDDILKPLLPSGSFSTVFFEA